MGDPVSRSPTRSRRRYGRWAATSPSSCRRWRWWFGSSGSSSPTTRPCARFPAGGGAAAAAGAAFGEGWAFPPIGALIVDFGLTIAISVAAAASALIAALPRLAPLRVPLAVVLLAAVAGLSWFGHAGRALFAAMTLGFLVVATRSYGGSGAGGAPCRADRPGGDPPAAPAVLFAFPVAMALATGVEAPSSAIAQLGQLDDAGRCRFGRVTLGLTLGVVGSLTLG